MHIWIKMGCGHLVGVPLVLVALLALLLMTGASGVALEEIIVLSIVVLAAGGIGGGVLVYVWREYLQALDDGTLYDTTSDPADASSNDAAAPSAASGSSTQPPDAQTPDPQTPDRPERLPEHERPWEDREEWADGRITTHRGTHDNNAGGWSVVGFGSLFAAIGLGLIGASIWTADDPWVLGLIFAAAGLGVAALGAYRIRRRQRYGPTTFVMDTLPGALGGPLCGMLQTGVRRENAPADGFRITLSCYRRRVTRDSDGDRDIDRTLLWRDEKQMDPRMTASDDTLAVPVVFECPPDKPPSTPEKRPNRYQWLLEASAEVPGVDYAAILDVPVFPVAPDDTAPVEAYTQYERHHDADTPTSRGIHMTRRPDGGLDVTFGRARRPWVALFFTVIAAPLTVLTIAVLPSLFQASLLGLMAGLVGWGALYYWTYRSRVTVDASGVTVQAGTPLDATTTTIRCADVQNVAVVASASEYVLHLHHAADGAHSAGADRLKNLMSSLGARSPTTGESWDDYMDRHGLTEHRTVAARMLTNHREAEWLASQIEQAAARHARRTERS